MMIQTKKRYGEQIMEFYHAEKVNDRLIMLKSLSGELLYLVSGEERAALIDTCLGVGNLRNFVETLTDRPLTVLLTHGHVDHAPGAAEFPEVWMNPKDIPLYQRQCALEERKGYLKAALGDMYKEIREETYIPPQKDYPFFKLTDGMEFDLGGVHIAAYDFPGHTPGSMVFLIREMRILILGDACNNSTFLFDQDACPLKEYMENVRKVRDRLKGKYDRVFLSHHDMETGTEIMDNVLDVCQGALEGKADDIPFDFMGNHAYIAKKCNEYFQREDGKCGNIIYSKEKLY